MSTESKSMQEIREIRLKIYEETQSMTPEERVKHAHKAAKEMAEKYGIELTRPTSESHKQLVR